MNIQQKPSISFYMTVKNGSGHISEAIQSVRNQTISSWELVIVDDGSMDSTNEIILRFSEIDNRINVVSTTGIGRGAALNRAIQLCSSDILTNLDADDLAHPRRVEFLLKAFDNKENYGAITGLARLFNDDMNFDWPNVDWDGAIHDVTKRLISSNPVSHAAVGLSRTALQAVGGYDENRLSQFDYDLWIRMADKGYKIGKINAFLGAKRIHSSQSYERRKHLSYAWSSAQVRWRAVKVLNASRLIGMLSVGAHLAWACLPSSIRMLVRRLLQ